MRTKVQKLFIIFLCLPALAASNISQWRGINRDGQYQEKNLLKQWPENGPPLLWSVKSIGKGYSSASVSQNVIYITGKIDTSDFLTAIDQNGQIKWQIPYGRAWNKTFPETRCTPTIENDQIYLISGQGEVVCISALTAQKVWSVAAFEKFAGKYGEWGIAESVLLVDNKVIYTPGGDKTTMIALDKRTGEIIWITESLPDYTAYVSPILITHGQKQIIVNVTAHYLFGVDAANGHFLWKYKYADLDPPTWHPNAPIINAISPLFHDGQIYVTSGYNHVGALFRLSEDASQLTLAWKDTTLDCHIGGVVLVDGYLYGANWISNRDGNWCCIDWQTGAVKYEKKWQTKGSIIAADGMLYCYEERRGHVALVKVTPDDFAIESTFRVTAGFGPHWAHPMIHDGILYLRHGATLLAYDIRQKKS